MKFTDEAGREAWRAYNRGTFSGLGLGMMLGGVANLGTANWYVEYALILGGPILLFAMNYLLRPTWVAEEREQ